MPRSFSSAPSSEAATASKRRSELAPVLAEDRLEHLVLRGEVVVEQAVRDARPPPRCRRRARCGTRCARRREPRRRGSGDASPRRRPGARPAGAPRRLNGQSTHRVRIGAMRDATQRPLRGLLVVDLCRYLPGAFASSELLRLGARVVRVESPDGDPMRTAAPAWDDALRRGKESVVCDLKREPELAAGLCARADVVLEGFRPGVAARVGVGPDDVPPEVVYCSITGFGTEGRHAARVGHDLNYLGWAGALADTAPALPPIQVADSRSGALRARRRDPRGARSARHNGDGRATRRLDDPRVARARLAPNRRRPDAAAPDGRARLLRGVRDRRRAPPDGRRARARVLLAAVRACRTTGPRRGSTTQSRKSCARELAAAFATRTLDEWLGLFDEEEVCVGPVATLARGARRPRAAGPSSLRTCHSERTPSLARTEGLTRRRG